jgi:AcrR family transcriptional regulator
MPKAPAKTDTVKITEATFRLAAADGWTNLTLEAIAKEAKLAPASFKKRFSSTYDLIPILVDEVTDQALASAEGAQGAPHDIVFDLMMARFDVLQKYREGVLAIAEEAQWDRTLASALTRGVFDSMIATIDAANLELPSRPATAVGLSAAYGWAFLAWRSDTSSDMSRTMAALDKALRLAGKAVDLVKRGF